MTFELKDLLNVQVANGKLNAIIDKRQLEEQEANMKKRTYDTAGKIVVLRPDGTRQIVDHDQSNSLRQLQQFVEGWIEIVRNQSRRFTVVLGDDLCKHLVGVVDDSGLFRERVKHNGPATWLLSYPHLLVGTVVIMREGVNADGEPDLLPLSENEADLIDVLLMFR